MAQPNSGPNFLLMQKTKLGAFYHQAQQEGQEPGGTEKMTENYV